MHLQCSLVGQTFIFQAMVLWVEYIYFSGNGTMGGVNIGSHANRCIVYAVIKDESAEITQTICGGYSRFQHIYTSESNSLEIRIVELVQVDGNAPNFVIEYEGMPALNICSNPFEMSIIAWHSLWFYVRVTNMQVVMSWKANNLLWLRRVPIKHVSLWWCYECCCDWSMPTIGNWFS